MLAHNMHEYIIVYELIENYSFILHSEDVSFQWNNAQDTVHPLVMHFRNADNTLSHTSCDSFRLSSHDTYSVYAFLLSYQKHVIQFILRKAKIKSNQISSVTSLIDLLLSMRIERFSTACVSMRRRMELVKCSLHLLAHNDECTAFIRQRLSSSYTTGVCTVIK
jgi:hypothetical protein